MKRRIRTVVIAVALGMLTALLMPVVVGAATFQPVCSTAGYVRLWTPRPAEITVDVPPGDHLAVLELINANTSTGSGYAKVGDVLVPAPTGICETASGIIGPYSGPNRVLIVAEPVGEISVWARVTFIPRDTTTTTTEPPTTTTTEPPTTTTEPPDTTTTTEPPVTTTTQPDLPPVEVTTTTTAVPPLVPPVPTTLPPVTTTTLPSLVPQEDDGCVPGGFSIDGKYIPFDSAPAELFTRFPGCRSAFDEESG